MLQVVAHIRVSPLTLQGYNGDGYRDSNHCRPANLNPQQYANNDGQHWTRPEAVEQQRHQIESIHIVRQKVDNLSGRCSAERRMRQLQRLCGCRNAMRTHSQLVLIRNLDILYTSRTHFTVYRAADSNANLHANVVAIHEIMIGQCPVCGVKDNQAGRIHHGFFVAHRRIGTETEQNEWAFAVWRCSHLCKRKVAAQFTENTAAIGLRALVALRETQRPDIHS